MMEISKRLPLIDILRGFAVLGTLGTNIWIFAMNLNAESKSYEITALENLGYLIAPEA